MAAKTPAQIAEAIRLRRRQYLSGIQNIIKVGLDEIAAALMRRLQVRIFNEAKRTDGTTFKSLYRSPRRFSNRYLYRTGALFGSLTKDVQGGNLRVYFDYDKKVMDYLETHFRGDIFEPTKDEKQMVFNMLIELQMRVRNELAGR